MTINLGSVEAVRRITGFSEGEMDDTTIESYLSEAERKMRAQHFNAYMQDVMYATVLYASGEITKAYELYFPLKAATSVQVYVNGVLQTLTTHYTVTGSTVTFTNAVTMYSGDRILINYTPEFFDDYANYLASEKILGRSVLDASNSVMLANYNSVKDSVKDFQKMIAQKPHMARSVDHVKDFSLW
jgi:hypothetical protein